MEKHGMNLKLAKTFFKKYALRIWIVLALFFLVGMTVYAAYAGSQNRAKKVLATSAQTQMRFSSNYLEEGTVKFKTTIKTQDDLQVMVSIRNNSRLNPTYIYPTDIGYIVTVRLTDTSAIASDDAGYASRMASILGNDSVVITCGNTTVTLDKTTTSGSFSSQKLAYNANATSENDYYVTFPNLDSGICVEMYAIPDSKHADLNALSAILAISDKNSLQSDGWTGAFNDSKSDGKLPSSYDAFNYSLTGHGYTSSATFSWDSTKLEVNKLYFSSEFGKDITTIVADENGWKTVTLSLDSKVNDRFDFQLFKVGSSITFDTWAELEESVRFNDGID